MSTIQKINFEPVSDVLALHRRDYPLADKTLADPYNAACLIDGEWVVLNAAGQILRAATIGTPGEAATLRSFPLWAERGRYDVRAQAEPKMPIMFMGQYEVDTRVFDASANIAGGDPITFVMQPLCVATITIGTRNYVGLVGSDGSTTNPIVGYVTKLPANNGGKLRFIMGWRS